jgi:hypothetical protein
VSWVFPFCSTDRIEQRCQIFIGKTYQKLKNYAK